MPRYYIKGEAGKALDATSRALGADLKVTQASLRFENLGQDRLAWTARTVDLDAGETILPEVGQIVELFHDNGGSSTRLFRGWVTEARHRNYGTSVVVDGPWQFLKKATAQTSKTLNGTTDERPTWEVAAGALATRIGAVVTAAIADGAPISWGGMSTAYNIHALKISGISYADVIAELLRWVPDAVAWFDYFTNPTGTPILYITRRAAMGTQTYDAASTASELVNYDATARPDLVPARVELKYIERGADERPLYRVQASGTSTLGRNQVIVVSGDENDTWLPRDEYDSYVVQTGNANLTIGNTRPLLLPLIPEVAASRESFPGRPSNTDVTLANGETITLQRGVPSGTYTFPQPPLQFLDAETGEPVSRTGKHFLLGSVPPEWAEGAIANAQRVKIRGRIYRLEESTLYQGFGTGGIDAPNTPGWSAAFPWSQVTLLAGYYPSNTIAGYPWARVYLAALDFEIETILTTTNQATPTTVYRPQDFEYLTPASGLAANLLAAQSFTPWDGFLEFRHAAAPAGPPALWQRTSISNAQADLASMAALRKATSLDLLAWTSRIELGAPGRFDFKTLVGKVRQTTQTNISINP